MGINIKDRMDALEARVAALEGGETFTAIGSADGRVSVSTDGGATWWPGGLPEALRPVAAAWVAARAEHDEARVLEALRDLDAARAEVVWLGEALETSRKTHRSWRDSCAKAESERDEAQAEVERLRESVAWVRGSLDARDDALAEVERAWAEERATEREVPHQIGKQLARAAEDACKMFFALEPISDGQRDLYPVRDELLGKLRRLAELAETHKGG